MGEAVARFIRVVVELVEEVFDAQARRLAEVVGDREGVGFAYAAAGRLAIASDTPLLDVRLGTYHGGVYVLHAYVEDAAVPNLPKMLEQTFEGFRVAWYPVSQLGR